MSTTGAARRRVCALLALSLTACARDGATSAEQLAALPGRIYAESAAGERDAVRRDLEDLVRPFFPVVAVRNESDVVAHLERDEPVFLDVQLDLLAQAYLRGQLISLDSFIAELAARGVVEAGTRRPVTREHLTRVLAPVARKRGLAEHEMVPALILALGHERASRTKAVTDSVWGDGWLDPLQSTLLLYAVGGPARQRTASVAGDLSGMAHASVVPMPTAMLLAAIQGTPWWRPNPVKVGVTVVTGLIGKAVEMPLTWGQAAKTSLCASVLLNAHRLTVKAEPTAITHRAHRNREYISRLTAELRFEGVARGKEFLDAACGTLPPVRGVPGKEVEWYVGDPLREHGRLTTPSSMTNGDGLALTHFRAVDEAVPEPMRKGLADEVNGPIHAAARGLVPGWSRLEVASNPGYWGPASNTARLSVHFYRPPSFEVTAVDGKALPVVLYRHGEGEYRMGSLEMRSGALELRTDGSFRLQLAMKLSIPGIASTIDTSETLGRWELTGDRLVLAPRTVDGESLPPEKREAVQATWSGATLTHPFPIREDDRVFKTPVFTYRQLRQSGESRR